MRKAIIIALVTLLSAMFILTTGSTVLADQYIKGYTRKDGTYVKPHYRSDPDSNPNNNYSYPGNTNPYTEKRATGNPGSYLNNYNKGKSYDSYRSLYGC